ncbi:MAG TPA: small ribosomal subunit Rsm22 family protein [Nitrospirota bacterium]|nr:small ribosomal subunit Rsm22 family protein [Nitrospirota bacterium]
MKPPLPHGQLKILAANIVRLSKLLTRERDSLPAAYLKDKGLREAYEAYFLPLNLRKILVPLAELDLRCENLFGNDMFRVLDLGCGPGTAMLGVMEFFAAGKKRSHLAVTAVDHVAENLKMAEEFFTASKRMRNIDASLKTIRSGIEQMRCLPEMTFNLIIFSNVLNELFIHDEARIVKRTNLVAEYLNRCLADDGSCIIIEPALRETSRELIEVREGLLKRGFHIYAPCLCHAECIALANPRDWCHEDLAWEPSDTIRELDELTGLRKDSLKFSYLIMRKDVQSLAGLYGINAFRVVSEPLVSKGKREFYICGEAGRRLITRLNKDLAARNKNFGSLQRGDVVSFEHLIEEGKRYKVGKGTGVKRLRTTAGCFTQIDRRDAK